jgi:hypothetical protein
MYVVMRIRTKEAGIISFVFEVQQEREKGITEELCKAREQ